MKKRITAIALSVLICLLSFPVFNFSASATSLARADVWDGTIASRFASGSGTASNPYLISTPEQLAYFRKSVSGGTDYTGKYVKLTNDIYINNIYNWINWGEAAPQNSWNGIHGFNGTFDGDGHDIYGLYGDGLFSRISGATVKNVGVKCSYVTNGGAVVGYAYGANTISACYNEGYVSGSSYAGGVVGHIYAYQAVAKVEKCYNAGIVFSQKGAAGGVVGHITALSAPGTTYVEFCYNSGNVEGVNNVGGIVGFNEVNLSSGSDRTSNSTIWNCYNSGFIRGDTFVGGIVGYQWVSVSGAGNNSYANSNIKLCYNVGAIAPRISDAGSISGGKKTVGTYYDINRYQRASVNISDCYCLIDDNVGEGGGIEKTESFFKSESGRINPNFFIFSGNCGYEYATLKGVPHKEIAFHIFANLNYINFEGKSEYGSALKVSFMSNNLVDKDTATYTLQWYRNGQPVEGQDGEYYYLSEEDIGTHIAVMATGSGNYTYSIMSDVQWIRKKPGEEIFNGDVKIIEVTDTSIEIDLPYGCETKIEEDSEWEEGKELFTNLTPNTTYEIYIRRSETRVSAATDPVIMSITTHKPYVKGTVTISGENLPGATLTAVAENTAEGETWQYQWYRDGVPIEGATSSVYVVTKFDRGKQLSCGIVGIGEYAGVSVSEEIPIQIIYVDGDVNGDGETQTTDLASIKLFLAGAMKEEEIDFYGADKDQNGDIDTSDLAALKIQLAENQ